jgi:hypothetical protein
MHEDRREEEKMTETGNGGAFPELFEVVRDYAQGDDAHQVQALRVIAAAYLPIFEAPPMPDARDVVEAVLARNGFLVTNAETGGIEPSSVDAVVSVATSRLDEADLEWGAACLMGMMDALRQRAQAEGYETFVLDAQEVLDGLETILAADIVEDVVEEALEEALDEALEDEDL